MKKQIIAAISTHPVRAVLLLILLFLLGSVMHQALAQGNTGKRSVAMPNAAAFVNLPQVMPSIDGTVAGTYAPTQPARNIRAVGQSQFPTVSSSAARVHAVGILPMPNAPQVVLYDQYNNAGANATVSATFTDFPTSSADLADDFVVPAGQTWNVQSIDADGVYFNGAGPATSWNVFIYANSGTLPGTQVFSATNQPVTQVGTTFTVTLPVAAVLTAGTYWIEIQANMTFGTQGEWGWTDRTVQSNSPAAWQNTGGGFGFCPTWMPKLASCVTTASGPDQVFRLNGTTGGGGGGCDNYTTTTSTGTITPGTTDSGNHCDDCATAITFPFPVSVYGQTFNSANVASNGALDLIGTQASFTHGCQVLPNTLWTMAILPYQDDLRTDNLGFAGCAGFPGGTCGVFTSVTGTAPNRHFNVEWRAVHFADTTTSANFEVVFSENQSSFDVIYGATSDNGLDETSGVQASATGPATTFSCGTATLANGLKVTYTCGCTQAWQNEPPIANARRNPATVVVGSNLYAITGFNAAPDYTAVNERFNGTSWTTLAPIPVPHAQSRGTAVGTNIYVPGGFNSVSFGGPLNTMQIYNTTANTWSSGMILPAARSGVATAAFNGLVYVIGGYNPTGTGHNEVYIYNPGTNSYTTGAPMTAIQGNAAGVLFNGEIYVVGGGTAPGAQYAYNPTTNTWRTIAVLPTTGGTCQSDNGFVLNNELWIVGCLGLPINQQVWIYNPGSNSWRAGPPYGVDHQGPGAALFNGRGFAVGGGAASGGSTAVESVNGCAAPCQFRVLIAYADTGGPPTTLQNQILAEPGVTAVDLFDAFSGTPTLAQLEQYDIVVAFSNTAYSNATAMGDVLADYADTGGVVVGLNFDWFGAPFGLAGRWMTGGYTPFNSPGPTHFATSCLGTYNTGHPLMQGISAGSLCAFFRHTLTLSPGAVSVAVYQDNEQLCAYKTNNGHTGVGINAYLGSNPENFSGPFGRVIVNAGRWLGGSCAPVPSSAVSRKLHGAFTGDINLPLTGNVGVECRSTGGTNDYTMVVTFTNSVTVNGSPQAQVVSGSGTVGTGGVANGGAVSISGAVVTIPLTNVTNAQRIMVKLSSVNDGVAMGDVIIPMGILIGDTSGNASVNASDVSQTKAQSGAAVTGSNFRTDVNANGSINASDVSAVKARSGTSLP